MCRIADRRVRQDRRPIGNQAVMARSPQILAWSGKRLARACPSSLSSRKRPVWVFHRQKGGASAAGSQKCRSSSRPYANGPRSPAAAGVPGGLTVRAGPLFARASIFHAPITVAKSDRNTAQNGPAVTCRACPIQMVVRISSRIRPSCPRPLLLRWSCLRQSRCAAASVPRGFHARGRYAASRPHAQRRLP